MKGLLVKIYKALLGVENKALQVIWETDLDKKISKYQHV